MTIKVHNSLTKKIEPFKPLQKGKVKIYTCGPTVYATPHIGNYRTFFMADMLRRYFEFKGFDVFHVMNITDIDDKTIRDSAEEGIPLEEFTVKYTKIFFEGIDWLNIKRAHLYPHATDHIDDMIDLVKKLIKKDYAYETDDGVYFNIRAFKKYGQLSNIDFSEQKVGERAKADEYDKKNVQDFVLWKKSSKEELGRGIFYESPWGKGRPGWHLECSVMSMKYLGETFDIHTGAVDLKFPHHENEIAQSEAATGKTFVRYWLHGEFLNLKEEKMSKSLGNITTLHELMDKTTPDTIRYFFLSTRYDAILNFSEDKLEGAKNSVERLKTTFMNVQNRLQEHSVAVPYSDGEKSLLEESQKARREFEQVMNNNFETPKALQTIHHLAKQLNIYLKKKQTNKGILAAAYKIFTELLTTFGLFEEQVTIESLDKVEGNHLVNPLVEVLIDLREKARKRKDYDTGDFIRDQLGEMGIILEDTKKGTTWRLES
jgi:cysteinyl-tRNA synthetase